MSLSRDARYALNLFVSDPDLRVNSETLRTLMGIGRPKSRKLIVELESAGYIIRSTNTAFGTALRISPKVQVSVPSDTLYSDIAFSPISNRLKAWYVSYIRLIDLYLHLYLLGLVCILCYIRLSVCNIITINVPVAQLMEPPKDKDRNGVLVDDLVFQCNRSAAAGDDELSIAFS